MDEYMDWNDQIQQDSSEFEVVPEGEYNFEVIKFERSRTDSDAKYPNCCVLPTVIIREKSPTG